MEHSTGVSDRLMLYHGSFKLNLLENVSAQRKLPPVADCLIDYFDLAQIYCQTFFFLFILCHLLTLSESPLPADFLLPPWLVKVP